MVTTIEKYLPLSLKHIFNNGHSTQDVAREDGFTFTTRNPWLNTNGIHGNVD